MTDQGERIARNLDDVFVLLDCGSKLGLQDALDAHTDLDVWIDWDGSDGSSLIVCIDTRGTDLVYPFPIDELWTALDELIEEVSETLDTDEDE